MSVTNENALFMSPQNAELDNLNVDYTPDLDYLDGDSFDFENADLGGEMIGALPGSGGDSREDLTMNGDGHEKRKSPDENGDSETGDAKRQETQEGEKGAKKPGRKPLTSEPTTKRKAQNRAAQRAFRERKEKHLKDLETKVAELTKTQEADKHENGLLKAQVERLQVELREYRKRLSLNSGVSRSPPLSATGQHRSNSNPSSYGGNFQFDFPKFGALPGSQIFGNQSNANGVVTRDSATPPTQSPTTNGSLGQQTQSQNSRQNSLGRSLSPTSGNASNADSPAQAAHLNSNFAAYSTNNNMHGFASTLPQMNGAGDPFGDLFSPSILKSASVDGYFPDPQSGDSPSNQLQNGDAGGDSTSGLNRVFQFNGGSNASDSTSPSASSSSQWNGNGANSSCGTSPEPSHGSPANKEKPSESFCEKINPKRQQQSNLSQQTNFNSNNQTGLNAMFGLPNTDFSSMGSFDPVLFGDYRDSNDAIVGNGDFSGGFFDEALNSQPFDYGSPSNLFGILQSPQQTNASINANVNSSGAAPSKHLMAEVEKTCAGGDDDYGLPNTQSKKTEVNGKLISCNNIWNQLQSNPDFQEGKFDLDGLCSELRAKARCSESGVMVDQDHVDAALRKLGKKDDKGKAPDMPSLMFEQESW
ncbi:hypothetical protein M409DRAFT_49418 [Zasmidium cellare ATCC 36951]|uniref:BZIP domain-containing protein n=1 Tax=Zasmidium cellare ATCC 36951 TaxID=1080233 RepID=A0A6A6D5G9_ZASCE|nr:uncharacterized protein M409DRAFT_49418 [Zasmidium cellare ATCC 36951]KAF2172906.1 hypothetical protein M409DRAFT_49418 [Zasmidium cellare ATCC 36951]